MMPTSATKHRLSFAGGWVCAGWLLVAVAQAAEARPDGAPVDFNFQVRPLLSDRCFKCHGPDERARKAKLRLDAAEGAYAVRDAATQRRAVVPGKPEQSELWRRVNSTDPDDVMPPPASKLSLSAPEKALLARWIREGARYERHWAFLPVGKVPVPKVAATSTAANPIDAFVVARLQAEGVSLSPPAARETLIRRLSLDLIGLPPSVAEVDAFVQDDGPGAYEALVDRLLASPHYGERRANEWLDLARYADTYGYQADVECNLSPWRDWVIRAFNDNLPYDQFITWQLAGDLLPEATRDQILATAFNRLHRQTNEGGSIEEEFRAQYVADRVDTFGTAFLGLTLGCARCHDHKYDPIPQRDYYRVSAFFNNIDESGLYSHFTRATPGPTLLLWPAGAEQQHRELAAEVARAEERLAEARSASPAGFGRWRDSGAARIRPPAPVAAFAFDEVRTNTTPDGVRTNAVATLIDGPQLVEGHHGRAMLFSGDNSLVCAGAGAFRRTDPFSFSLWLRPSERQARAVVFHRSRAWTDSGSRGYELVLDNGRPAFGLIHFWPGNAVQVRAVAPLPTNVWTHLAITYDGSSRAAGLVIYVNGQPATVEVIRDHLFKDILHRQEWGDADVGNIELTLAGRFRDSGFRNGAIDEFQVYDTCLTPGEVALVAGGTATPAEAGWLAFYQARIDPGCRSALEELRRLRERENQLVNDVPEIMVMREMPGHRPTFVLRRGAYDAPGEPVEPGMPDGVFPFAADLPRNRLGLARWLVDRRNPLTARVVVNRVWRTHFGRGLVATAEDFGSQGQLPTHPALLDWLAGQFMDSGWNLKALHKRIVMSATYRQSSHAPPGLLARDPENLLLARGPSHRLQAEQIRDSALAVSGLLNPQIGGPSVKPYQPVGLWEESGTGKTYTQDHGDKLYRRSLYTFWRRTAPPPSMLTFDATSREVCTARRETTTTPLQALVLLNDPQFLEASRAVATRVLHDCGGDLEARIRRAFRIVINRDPRPREVQILTQLYREQLELFTRDAEASRKYLKVGESPVDPTLPPGELAATAVLASTVMNLDEFVMER